MLNAYEDQYITGMQNAQLGLVEEFSSRAIISGYHTAYTP